MFHELPSIDWIRTLIKAYDAYDGLQTVILWIVTIYTIRWAYADSVVREKDINGFLRELGAIAAVNLALYLFISPLLFHQDLVPK